MFTPEDIQARTRRQPFQPFRIVTSTGQTYDIMHADMAMAAGNRLIVGIPKISGALDRFTEIAIFRITELQDMPVPTPTSSNGPTG